MLTESYMRLPMYGFCMYKNLTFFAFRIFASTMMPSSVLFCNFVKLQDQPFHIQRSSQMSLFYRFQKAFNFDIYYICYLYFFYFFFDILFTEIQVIFINFPILYFLAKKRGKIYFSEHSQQNIALSHRLTLRVTTTLYLYTIFPAADWNNNTTLSFPVVKL